MFFLISNIIVKKGAAGKPLHVTSEKDIYDHLGIEYKKPEDRSTAVVEEELFKKTIT